MEISIPKIMVSPSYLWFKVEFTTKRINVVNVKELISPTNNLVFFFFFHLSTIVIDFFFFIANTNLFQLIVVKVETCFAGTLTEEE